LISKKISSEAAWPNESKGEDFLEISQSKTRMACGDHVC
jgi:hypothetical protein